MSWTGLHQTTLNLSSSNLINPSAENFNLSTFISTGSISISSHFSEPAKFSNLYITGISCMRYYDRKKDELTFSAPHRPTLVISGESVPDLVKFYERATKWAEQEYEQVQLPDGNVFLIKC